ncbi:hypothetical protein BDA96_06G093200 [Sorghum bicolor]|uniref:Uncharacterized protein n=2 Tax=Sorghum bicolor TaxID=4558 RepID=A0A921UBG5_SORBI|nr:hypothetical protein BDA96_06G093200 [Sorghum bicolor]OQU81607.1 hypothetical protein SORBI_3006G084701 [Sorghum bicolor]
MSRPRWSAASAPDNHIEKAYAGLVPMQVPLQVVRACLFPLFHRDKDLNPKRYEQHLYKLVLMQL